MSQPLDVITLVPLQALSAVMVDPVVRRTVGAHLHGPLVRAYAELCGYLGTDISFGAGDLPRFGGAPLEISTHRSLASVCLATHLERAGLSWEIIDPGMQDLRYYRRRLEQARARRPRAVAICTTFIVSGDWLHALCATVRSTLPDAKILLGGYYYTTDVRDFLTMDADVFCVGEGEVRLPQIVAALRDGTPLDGIRGLYLRAPSGPPRYTGDVEPLDLRALPQPDYRLAERIEPPVQLDRDILEVGLETQRGCVFKCEFCTYRTLSAINLLGPEEAAERILGTRVVPRAIVALTDATATFPHARWEEILEQLIAKGGSPHPLWAYARVSDITDRTASLMARAGVRELLIGQESGDQRVLNLMKKGTRVDQVRPALRALRDHGITAFFTFIHGFPGETRASCAATRALITSLNEEAPERPTVLWYKVDPFVFSDFASVAQRDDFKNTAHRLDYAQTEFTARQACDAVLETIIAASRVPHAPAYEYLIGLLDVFGRRTLMGSIGTFTAGRGELHRWVKAIERGLTIFLERDLEGTPPDGAELRRLRGEILARYPDRRPHGPAQRALYRAIPTLFTLGMRECAAEGERPGPLTNLGLAALALYDTGRLGAAAACLRTGRYHPALERRGARPGVAAVDTLADALITGAADAAKRSRKNLRVFTRTPAAG